MAPLTLTLGCKKETSGNKIEILSMWIILDTKKSPYSCTLKKREKKVVSALGI